MNVQERYRASALISSSAEETMWSSISPIGLISRIIPAACPIMRQPQTVSPSTAAFLRDPMEERGQALTLDIGPNGLCK